ncbi:MAG TPA: hypothetical protein VNO20_00680 [Solirubrobacterales bacterium]|nr:hypothetical protein [Solirubrobacterales bacterium]
MIATYASAALICAASLLVGRAVLSLAGRREWSWLEPAVGFAAILTVTGALARAPGHSTTATLGLIALLVAAVLVCRRLPYRGADALGQGLAVALVVALVLSIPFAVSGRWGFLGQGFNNDLGLHLAWAEWLRSGLGPAPEAGYPLGPHGLAAAVAAVPGISLGQAFVGQVFAIGLLTALTALSALRELGTVRRVLAATLVATTYLAASYFAQGAFKETAEALLVLAFVLALRNPGQAPAGAWPKLLFALPYLALLGGAFFAYSFAGLAWPLAILVLWSLTLPEVRSALAPRALLRFLLRPAVLIGVLVLAGLGAVTVLVGPFGFIHGFNRVAGSNTYGPVSPIEALGIWPTSNYRLDAVGGAQLTGLAGAVAVLAVAVGVLWWVRIRDLAVPIALGACAALYVASLPFSGEYSQAKALMIAAPLAMLVAIRPLLSEFVIPRVRSLSGQARQTANAGGVRRIGWGMLAVAFIGGAAYSSFLALRDAPVGPPGHGAELRAFFPLLKGEKVLYAGQDRYAAHELLEADTHVPLVEFPDSEVNQNPEKPFDTGDAYSPIDFDSFSTATLDRVPYVVTGRAEWNSQGPPNFRRVAATDSYLLWERQGPTPEDRHVLLEGTEPAAPAPCASPEIRILLASPGRASLFPAPAIGAKAHWSPDATLEAGESAAQRLRLPAGRWRLSLQYFSPFDLTLSAPGFRQPLKAALDGQRPSTISLASDGQYWPAGVIESAGGPVRFTIDAEEPSTLQRLSGYEGKARLGNLVAVRAEPRRIVPLAAACNGWIDWFESPEAP